MLCARYLVIWLLLGVATVVMCGYYVECCVEVERVALLEIKSYMQSYSDNPIDPDELLQPWYNNSATDDCCEWYGVQCNVSTGRVTELDLNTKVYRDIKDDMKKHRWMFNVTLFRPFRQLISLKLAFNHITGLVEQDGSTTISTLKNLQHLVLDGNSFEKGYLSVGVLKSLRTLSLGSANLNEFSFLMSQELPSLTELQTLDLSINNISNHAVQGVCKLKNLVELRLGDNLLHGFLPSCFKNLSSLQILDLSNNKLSGKFPQVISSFRFLEYLDLSHNYFEGNLNSSFTQVFDLSNNKLISGKLSLNYLDLSHNYFEGKFSLTCLTNFSRLQVLRLSGNMLDVRLGDSSWRPKFQLQTLELQGCNLNKTFEAFPAFWSHQTNISTLDLSNNNLLLQSFPGWLFNNSSKLKGLSLANNSFTGYLQLSCVAKLSLQLLDISNNSFSDKLPENIGLIFPHLNYLNLARNYFEGSIPSSIAHIKGLWLLDLSNNNFSGEFPRRLFSDCNSISVLDLSNNNFEGDIITKDMNLPELYLLDLSNNNFSGTVKGALLKSSDRLYNLDLSNNNITGQLPSWIGKFSILYSLSMSQNNLHGQIPRGICNLELNYLDLSQNRFSGSIPSCSNSCSFRYLHLHGNNLSGKIPDALSSCTQLQTLDLSDNQLSGGIPLWINKLSNLTILMLAGNKLHGSIPQELCQLSAINILDLSNNGLFGGIPICIGNLSFGLKILTTDILVGGFQWEGDFGDMTYYYQLEEVKFLNKNQFLSYKGRNLVMMSMLDLSSNKLTGNIPPQLGTLEQIHTLNLSHNFLSGSIPSQFSNLKQVESLDLSFNRLSGKLPSQLGELTFLEIFNVSYNNLSGRVPDTGQFASFDERNYYGNPELFGYHHQVSELHNPNRALPPATSTEQDDEGDEDYTGIIEMEDFLWSFRMSCVVMFLATIIILYINPQWRRSWFEFVDYHVLWWFPQFKFNRYY